MAESLNVSPSVALMIANRLPSAYIWFHPLCEIPVDPSQCDTSSPNSREVAALAGSIVPKLQTAQSAIRSRWSKDVRVSTAILDDNTICSPKQASSWPQEA